jgi:hypothetical protein
MHCATKPRSAIDPTWLRERPADDIDADYVAAGLPQRADQRLTQTAGTTGDEDFHDRVVTLMNWCTVTGDDENYVYAVAL